MRRFKNPSAAGKAGRLARENKRLEHVLEYKPHGSYLVFELHTHNPCTGAKNHLEIRHEEDNGPARYCALWVDNGSISGCAEAVLAKAALNK